jgi:AbrB family looped-hinge helix DNA binding protein
MSVVKLGTSRQIVIPKKLHDQLGLGPGDTLEVELRGKRLILTPKTLVDQRLAEGLKDVKQGRVYGPFNSADELLRSLHQNAKRLAKKSKARK